MKEQDGTLLVCSNCGKTAIPNQSIVVRVGEQIVTILCPSCQQAKKIQITLKKNKDNWEYYQFFPVEG